MTKLIALLSDLRSRGVVLSVEGDRLKCSAPKGVMTPEIRQELAAHKQEIFKLLREPSQPHEVEPETDASELPLSHSQRRLWFIQKLDSGNPVYHMAIAIEMTGALQRNSLEDALHILVKRHESLRTGFQERDGHPFARIVDGEKWTSSFVDLSHLPQAAAEEEAGRLAVEDARKPFALDDAPLIRAVLYRVAQDRHLLLMVMHHIVSDGWSLGILAREVGVLYADLSSGRQPSLPALKSQFQNYVRWENENSQAVSETHLPFWLEHLKAPLPLLALSGKRRPAVPGFCGRQTSMVIDASLAEPVRELCRKNDVTPFMFLLAVFKVLLCRYTGQMDLLVATANSNRMRAEFSPVVGFFVDNLVLRSDLSGNPRFQDFLSHVRQVTHEAYAHQELPFRVLMEKLQPERELNRNPLFQVAFVMQNVPLEPIQLPGLSIEAKPLDIGISPMDLSIRIWPDGKAYRWDLEYSTDLFDQEFIVDLQNHYLNLLRRIVSNPEERIENIPLISDEEKQKLLIGWNATARSYPSLPMHEVFEECVRAHGGETALTFAGGTWTYPELNQRANAIAAWLVDRRLPEHSFVAVCAPGSPLGIAAFLGILKAGHAYFPITASDPPERLQRMLEDAGTMVLLTTTAFYDSLGSVDVPSCVLLEDISGRLCENLTGSGVTPDDPACLMFTSGSSGRPKAVVVPHRGIVRLVRGIDYVRFAPDEVFLQISALTFDASTFEIWGALLNGSRLVLMESERPNAEAIDRAIRDQGVTTLMMTTALFHYFVTDHLDAITPLRQINVGGDVLSPLHAARLLRAAPHIHLANAYGPTENSTITTAYKVGLESLDGNAIPIGRPIGNTCVFLLDAHRQPVPVGAVGELYVAGDGLALGYLNAPAETGQAFVTLQFDEVGSVPAYRTGDLARYRPDGTLEFLGRMDKQTKINGYRIEPGEVEEALLSLEGIRAAVVSPRTSLDGDKRLIAYVAPEQGIVLEPHELQLQLRRVLPRPQVPAAFVMIAEIPRTLNGKIDYAALDALPIRSELAKTAGRGPANRAEEILLDTFKALLQVERFTVEDDFFSLGGHSLLAMQLLSRIKASFGVSLSVAEIFQNSTVELLAKRVDAAGGVSIDTAPAIVENGNRAATNEHALSRAQRRLWFLDQMDPGNPVYNIAIALNLSGPLDRKAFEEAFRMIVARHESLRTRFLQRDGLPYAIVEDAQNWAVAFTDLSFHDPETKEVMLRQLIHAESQRPYAQDKGPLFRMALYRKSEREHVVLISMHHIISDGWSIGVLARELGYAYEARVKNLPDSLPLLPIQFRDFVNWEAEQERLSSSEDLAYWRKQLGGELPRLELPVDHRRPPVQTFRGQRVVVDLDTALESELQKIALDYNATFFMVLLAAFSVLLRHYTRQENILIGTPTAGRTKSSFEGLIGFFVNNLVLRVDLGGDPSFAELLRKVRNVSLEAFEHQNTPFDRLVEMLQPERSLDRSPIFQTLFTLQNTTIPRVHFDELEMTPLELEGFRARYDLAVDIYPYEDCFRCNFEFNTDILEEATVRQMMQHYVRILKTVCMDIERPISKMHLLDADERRQLVRDWNNTSVPPPVYATIPAWFRAQACKFPDATALVTGEQELTWQELDVESNNLAVALRSGGIGRGTTVGIYLRRSPKMIIALLGVLKAGAAYLPLDPALPPQRVEFLLSDSEAQLILTERGLSDALPATQATLLLMEEVEDANDNCIPDIVRGEDLAYLIYTSGSTGAPKGTEIQHRALVNLLESMLKEPGLTNNDTLVAVTTLSFDIAGLEIWGALLSGAKLVLASQEQVLDPQRLADLLDSSCATVMQATPSTWRMLVESGWMGRSQLRIWCGGEALSPELAESLVARGCELWNLYGPTETTIWSAVHRVRSGEDPVLIGRPMANTQMYILDEKLSPVPVGVTGELYIGGEGVARGYWKRPELTSSRFLPNPFDPKETGRMYRTGDLARYRRDGQIQLLGRTDHQVKLRGHRIELGEIEIAIERHPAVRQAVVMLQGNGADKQLTAYIRYIDDVLDADQIRWWLLERLPDYMVPAVVVSVAEMPLTPNGKIDRNRLPALQPMQRARRGNSIPARNQTERRLSEMWSDVLQIEQPGIRENFFDLGGHSLLLIQLHARLKREFNTDIAVVDMFRYPTIEALASYLDRKSDAVLLPLGVDAK